MNKSILFILVGLLLISCKKDKVERKSEQPVIKSFTYHVFAAQDYSNTNDAAVQAEVKLQIQKINYTTGALTVLWDTTFAARDLQAYPLYNNKYIVTKQFPVYESKDKLNGSYGIKYTHNGMIWQAGEASGVVPGMLSEILEVNL